MTTPVVVRNRVFLQDTDQELVIEHVDGYCFVLEQWLNEWRLISLSEEKVIFKDKNPSEVLKFASSYQTGNPDKEFDYLVESTLYYFKDLPLKERLRYIEEHAKNLTNAFLELNDKRDPFEIAALEIDDMYNEFPCFYFDDKTEKWEIDVNVFNHKMHI